MKKFLHENKILKYNVTLKPLDPKGIYGPKHTGKHYVIVLMVNI